jgi:hypothetical protein
MLLKCTLLVLLLGWAKDLVFKMSGKYSYYIGVRKNVEHLE